MKRHRFLALTPILLLSACIPSVHPFFLTSDLTYDPALLGNWRGTDGDDWEQWTFAERDGSSYAVTLANSENKKAGLTGHLFTLAGRRYLDLTPDSVDYAKDQHDIIAASVVRGHLLARLDQEPGGIRFAFFDFEWLDNYLENHPGELAHRSEGDVRVLTATTPELQRFVLAHASDDGLFELEDRPLYAPVPAAAPLPPATAKPTRRTE